MEKLPPPHIPQWISNMVGFERYMVDVGNYRMHVMETGRGRPVLLQHGNPTWGILYRKVARMLAGEPYRLIMPDLIGLGFSDKPRDAGEHTLENHAAWLGRLIDELDLEDLIFVGQDWGGPIGLRALADRQRRVSGLVVLNTAISPPKPGFKPTAFHRFSNIPVLSNIVFRGLGFPQNIMRFAQHDPASISERIRRAYRYPLRALRDNIAPLALARMVPDSFEHPSIEPLRKVQDFVENFSGPAAIVWGDNDPILGGIRTWVEKLLPQAKVWRTEAGHFLQEEVPETIAGAIRYVDEQIKS